MTKTKTDAIVIVKSKEGGYKLLGADCDPKISFTFQELLKKLAEIFEEKIKKV